jgi:hypothetical protein
MAIDPNIALGVRSVEFQNPLAQYGQIAAIQNAQNQNALAQFQLSSAQRQEEAQNALSESYKRSINPQTGQLDPKLLISNVAQSKAAHLLPDIQSKLLESQTKEATLGKTLQETKTSEFKLMQDKLKHGWMSMGEASTPQAAIEKLQDGVKQGYFDFATAQKEVQQLQSMTPDQYQQWRIRKVMGLLDAKDQLGAMLPKVARQDIGGSVVSIQDNPMLPGYGMPVAGMNIGKTATIADNLAAAKFNWEKANPNQTIHEDANGLLAVNNRTGVATPVVYGPMGIQPAPAAAPAGGPSIMRQQPNAGMPSARIPAVPGMTSVLDQTAAPAAMPLPTESGARVAGAPVGGKERNLPEHFVKTDMQLSGLAGSLKQFKDEVKANPTTGAKWLPTGSDTARMQAKYTSLLMGLKDLYTLGALTGPDMSIIESQITNPASWTGKFTTKRGFEEQIQTVEDMLKRSATNLENSYGKTPKATKAALQALPGGVDAGIPNATPTNPLGLAIPGVR